MRRQRRYVETPSENYDCMLRRYDGVPFVYVALAKICSWMMLTGFITFPSAYGVIRHSRFLEETGVVGEYVQKASQAVPWIVLASLFCGLSACGMSYLLWYFCFVDLYSSRCILMPLFSNSLTGLISTLLNVYNARHGEWSAIAVSITAVMGSVFFVAGAGTAYLELKIHHVRSKGLENVLLV